MKVAACFSCCLREVATRWVALASLLLLAVAAPPTHAASDAALRLLGVGNEAYRAGDFVQATLAWTQAIDFCRLEGDAATEGEARARRGEALQTLGFLRDAISDLESALKHAEATRDPVQTAALTGALGNAYLHARDLKAARPMIERSLAEARRSADHRLLAASLNNFGNLQFAFGDTTAAAAAYEESAKHAERAGDKELASTATVNGARVAAADVNSAAAISHLNQALSRTRALPPSHAKASSLVSIGRIGADLAANRVPGALEVAYRAYREGGDTAEEIGDRRELSLANGYLGELYLAAGRTGEAEMLTERALTEAQRLAAPDLLYRWEWQRGRLLRNAGEREKAIGAYRRAVASVQSIRLDIPVEYRAGRSSFRDTIGPLFTELADLLLQSAPMSSSPAELATILDEARDTVELIKVAELRDYFQDRCIVELQARTRGIESVATRTVAIYPVVLSNRLELLLSFADGLKKQVTVTVDQSTLTAAVRRFRQLLEQPQNNAYLASARQLYDWIIRPLEPELAARSIETIVFVPEGPLRTIPLAALHDGKDFLIRRYAVATAPGLTLIDPKPLGPSGGAEKRTLITGLTEGVQGYEALPSVATEVQAIGRMEKALVLMNEEFQAKRVEEELRRVPYSIVHIASHGEFDSDPEKTFLLTHDGKLTLDELENAVKYSRFREQPLELLTLSACRTAMGDDRAALGLAGVAIKAGARSALATLWSISDDASAELVVRFYESLRRGGTSKAKAVQEAQLATRDDRRFEHPFFWAAFLMLGNWL
jgi:CHAT domain-containing protein